MDATQACAQPRPLERGPLFRTRLKCVTAGDSEAAPPGQALYGVESEVSPQIPADLRASISRCRSSGSRPCAPLHSRYVRQSCFPPLGRLECRFATPGCPLEALGDYLRLRTGG